MRFNLAIVDNDEPVDGQQRYCVLWSEDRTKSPFQEGDGAWPVDLHLARPVKYELVAGPKGAAIDPEAGVFTWEALKEPRIEKVTIRVRAAEKPEITAEASFTITTTSETTSSGAIHRPVPPADAGKVAKSTPAPDLKKKAAKAAIVPPATAAANKWSLEEIGHVPIHTWFHPLAFSPDSEFVAIDNATNLKLVELKTGKPIYDINPGQPVLGGSIAVTSAVISPDGNIIASYEDQVIRVWDRTTGQKLRDLGPGPQGEPFWDLRYSRLGKWVIGRGQTELRIWDLRTGKVLNRFPQPDPVVSLDLHPNGRRLVTLDRKNGIRFWDASTGNLEGKSPDPTMKMSRVSFTPTGRLLCLYEGIPGFSIWNPDDDAVPRIFQGPVNQVIDAAVIPNTPFVAAIYSNNNLRLWNTTTGLIADQKPFKADLLRVGISPNGKYAVTMFPEEAIIYRIEINSRAPAAARRKR